MSFSPTPPTRLASRLLRISFVASQVAVLSLGFARNAVAQTVAPEFLSGLKWRNIGPFRGGRVSAVTGVVTQPDTFYFGLPQGGVWKTTSAGQTWYPVFDSVKDVSSVGSLQVAPSDPNVVYAGTGEISGGGSGNGVYRSSDAGKSWAHVGLDATRMIPSLLVDPHDANLVLAAALGTGDAQGGFRSTDGGKTWTKTLDPGKGAGVQHLAWAYDNPRVIFASTRTPYRGYTPPGGKTPEGPEIYKSTDEGVTWTPVKGTGLPRLIGRFCVAVAQKTNSQRVFVIGTFGLYRSDDGGATWRQMAADDSRIANGQGEYTSGVYVDPQNPDIVYTLATCVYRSLDGGKTFQGFKGAPGGDDPQQLWIDPLDRTHILYGGDQGAVVSLDAGKTWGSWYNQPTGQVYHVSTDTRFPYWVYATQQDSGCVATSSRGNLGAITTQDWVAQPGSEGGFIVTDPLNPNVSYCGGVYGGLVRVTFPSEQTVQIEPGMSPTAGLRGNGAMMFSPANPRELLISYQYLLSTTDGGSHWRKLGPDLTAAPVPKGSKPSSTATYAFITSFSPSPLDPRLIWAGTSNGFIKLTRNHGGTWEDVSLPAGTGGKRGSISCVEASKVDRATAYISVSGPTPGKSNIFRTHDYGRTWQVAGGNGSPGFIAQILSDPKSKRLLFGRNASALLVSFDEGDHWQSLNLNLPKTSFSDLQAHGHDLVLGTFGRGIWILDDYSALREMSPDTASQPVHLYKPSVATRLLRNVNADTPFPPEVPHADNPPLGAVIYYSLATKPISELNLEIVDAQGRVVRHMSSAPITPYDDPPPPVATYWPEIRKPMPTDVGLNRINWNVRYDTPPAFVHDGGDNMGAVPGDTPEAIEGPLALPGQYTLRLSVDGKTYTQPLTVRDDPRSTVSMHDLVAEDAFRMRMYAGIQEAWDGFHQVEKMQSQLAALIASKPSADVLAAATEFDKKLALIGGTITRRRRFYGPPPPVNFVGLNGYLLARLDVFDYGDIAPTEQMESIYAFDWAKLNAVADKWRTLSTKGLAALNARLKKDGVKTIEFSGPTIVDPPAPAQRYLPKSVAKKK
ncbi:MAG: hypothetical protein ACYC96_08855 [Fimbriimonadaceae bacterium]